MACLLSVAGLLGTFCGAQTLPSPLSEEEPRPYPRHCLGKRVCLTDGASGIVLVNVQGRSGHQPVCDDAWDKKDADVACHEAGYLRGALRATTQGNSAVLPAGCSVQVTGANAQVYFNTNASSTGSCGHGVDTIEGVQESLVTLGLSVPSMSGATITMTGPSGNWFGVGLGTHVMPSAYAIVVDGSGKVTEHLLGHHTPGTVLSARCVRCV